MDKTARSSSARNNQGDKCFVLQVYSPKTAGLRTPSLPRAQEQIEKRTTMCSRREDRHRDTDTQKETIRERERGRGGECSVSSTRSWCVFGFCRYGEKWKLFDTTQTLVDSNTNTFCKRDNKTQTTTIIYSSAKERVLQQCGKTKGERERGSEVHKGWWQECV